MPSSATRRPSTLRGAPTAGASSGYGSADDAASPPSSGPAEGAYSGAEAAADPSARDAPPCDALAPEAGGRLWRHVLRPGGSAEPVAAFSELLGANALQQLGGGWAPDAAAALSDILRDSGC
jgi:hypothetical protein